MTTNLITIPVTAIKTYLNKALVFVNKAKMGLHPLFSSIYLAEDKMYVYNGETGAIINLPFKVEQPALLIPFDLGRAINATRDDQSITLDFNHKDGVCKVTTPTIKLKVRLSDPSTFTVPEIPEDLVPFEVEDIYEKLKRATFCGCGDATAPAMQGVRVGPGSVCAANLAQIWREAAVSEHTFVMPRLLLEHMTRLGIAPAGLALNASQIHLLYADMIVFGSRLKEEAKFPGVDAVFEQAVFPVGDIAVVEYDQEALKSRLEQLLEQETEEGIHLSCIGGVLTAHNILLDDAKTAAEITMEVKCSADFKDVRINAQTFAAGVERFTKFSIKADERRVLFFHEQQHYCISRRAL